MNDRWRRVRKEHHGARSMGRWGKMIAAEFTIPILAAD